MNIKMCIENKAKKTFINSICSLIEKNPINNLPKILNLAMSFTKKQTTKDLISYFNNCYNTMPTFKKYIEKALNTTDIEIIKQILIIFSSNEINDENINTEKFSIPFSLIVCPSSKCNLKCKNTCCNKQSETPNFEDINRTVSEAEALGINCIFLVGGEPFFIDYMYKLYEKHKNILFVPFTNGTLFTKSSSKKILDLKNVFPIIYLDGLKDYTDSLCGANTFDTILNGIDILNSYSIPYAINCTTISKNFEEVTSDKFVDLLIRKNSKFTIYSSIFRHNYNINELMNNEQILYLSRKVENIRKTKPYFLIDLFNDEKHLKNIINDYPSLKNADINRYEQNFCTDLSKFNIKSVSLKDILLTNNN